MDSFLDWGMLGYFAGGVAGEVRTAAPSDFITSAGHRGGYILSARDLIACDIEDVFLAAGHVANGSAHAVIPVRHSAGPAR